MMIIDISFLQKNIISTYEYFTFQFLCCAVHCIYYIPELACVSIFISVLLLLATCFAQFITGKSKSWQILSMVLIVDLYEVQNPALLNVLYT